MVKPNYKTSNLSFDDITLPLFDNFPTAASIDTQKESKPVRVCKWCTWEAKRRTKIKLQGVAKCTSSFMHSVCCRTVTYLRILRAITPCHITNARRGADETESEAVPHCWAEERRKLAVPDGKSCVKAIIAHG